MSNLEIQPFHERVQVLLCTLIMPSLVSWSLSWVGVSTLKLSNQCLLKSFLQYHWWLSEINAPIGSKEVIDHTHKWPLLIGGCMPECRLNLDWHHMDMRTQQKPLPNDITSLDPTGALISVNPGWYICRWSCGFEYFWLSEYPFLKLYFNLWW